MAKKKAHSCDWRSSDQNRGTSRRKKEPGAPLKTRLMKHGPDFSWSGVKTERYKCEDGTWSDVIRRTLVGEKGERTKFHLRYFEVAPGGHTTLESHTHEHVVIGVRGRGACRIKGKNYEIGIMDTIYIPPDAPHRLSNPFKEPFGFFCIVDARRDKPRPVQ